MSPSAAAPQPNKNFIFKERRLAFSLFFPGSGHSLLYMRDVPRSVSFLRCSTVLPCHSEEQSDEESFLDSSLTLRMTRERSFAALRMTPGSAWRQFVTYLVSIRYFPDPLDSFLRYNIVLSYSAQESTAAGRHGKRTGMTCTKFVTYLVSICYFPVILRSEATKNLFRFFAALRMTEGKILPYTLGALWMTGVFLEKANLL